MDMHKNNKESFCLNDEQSYEDHDDYEQRYLQTEQKPAKKSAQAHNLMVIENSPDIDSECNFASSKNSMSP